MSTPTATQRPPEIDRTQAPVVAVPPALLKAVLEACGYVATAANPFCWLMMRDGRRPVSIPRLGQTVGIGVLYSTLASAGIGPKQFIDVLRRLVIAARSAPVDQVVSGPEGGAR